MGYRNTANINSFVQLLKKQRVNIDNDDLLNLNQNWGLAFMLGEDVIDLVLNIKNNKSLLNDYFEISQGYIPYRRSDLVKKYGNDKGNEIVDKRLWHSNKKESKEYLPEIFGRNLSKYSTELSENKSYVKYGKHLACYVDLRFFNQKRVLVREITNPGIIATIINNTFVNDPQLISVIPKTINDFSLEMLWCILNSKLATFFHFNHSPKATKGAFPKVLIKDIKEFPIPKILKIHQKPFEILVDKIIAKKELGEDTTAEERKIDLMVYKLYDLTYDEVKIVEPAFAMTKKEYENYE